MTWTDLGNWPWPPVLVISTYIKCCTVYRWTALTCTIHVKPTFGHASCNIYINTVRFSDFLVIHTVTHFTVQIPYCSSRRWLHLDELQPFSSQRGPWQPGQVGRTVRRAASGPGNRPVCVEKTAKKGLKQYILRMPLSFLNQYNTTDVPHQGAATSLTASSWGRRRRCEAPAPWSGTPSRTQAGRWTTDRNNDEAGTWTTAEGWTSTS